MGYNNSFLGLARHSLSELSRWAKDDYWAVLWTTCSHLKVNLVRTKPGNTRWKVVFHHGNALTQTYSLIRAALQGFRYETVPSPAYSFDLVHSDFFSFPILKENLEGKRFAKIDETKNEALRWLTSNHQESFRSGLEGREHSLLSIDVNESYSLKTLLHLLIYCFNKVAWIFSTNFWNDRRIQSSKGRLKFEFLMRLKWLTYNSIK